MSSKTQVETPHTFELGDIVEAKENAPYVLTKNGWKGEVTRVINPDTNPQKFNLEVNGFEVNATYFTLVKKGTGVIVQKRKMLVLTAQNGGIHLSEFYNLDDIQVTLNNLLISGEGFKPNSVKVFEITPVEVAISLKAELSLK